jgi:hypothetical protein
MPLIQDDSNTDLVLNLSLPPGTDPAIASSLKRGLEGLLTVVLAMPEFESGILQAADELALAFIDLAVPAAPLIEERIHRQKAMREVFARGDWLTAEQINTLQAVPPGNEAHLSSDWKRQGRIFSVTFGGKEYFAGYQFDAMCQPLPVIRDILEALGPVEDPWKIAAWFHFSNGWMSSHCDHQGEPVAPIDALGLRDAVVEAAHRMRGTYVA